MSVSEEDKIKIKHVLSATIASLCNNGLNFNLELHVQGLIGITLDKECVILVNINEVLVSKKRGKPSESHCKTLPPKTEPTTSKSNESTIKGHDTSNVKKDNINTKSKANLRTPPAACRKSSAIHKASQPEVPHDTTNYSSHNVKNETPQPKIVTERLQTECLSMQQHDGGYAEVQQSIKTFQHPEGVVEEKQVEWKTYDADGHVLEHKKVEAVQTVAQPLGSSECNPQYVDANMMQENYTSEHGANQVYEGDQEDYYYGQEFENYSEGYSNDQNYHASNDQYNSDFNHHREQEFQKNVRGKESTRRTKRGARSGNSSRGKHSAEPRNQAGMSPMEEMSDKTGSTKHKGTLRKVPQQFHQSPPPKRQNFQQHCSSSQQQQQQPQQFQHHQTQGYVKSPAKGCSSRGRDLVQKAIDVVNEGKMSAAAAANLFGIPKSTLYRKLSMNRARENDYETANYNEEEWIDHEGQEQMDYGDYYQ